jgi:peptide chain release factor
VRKQYTRGSGNGGQHRNKVETCVQLIDEATGIIIKAQDTRNRGKNEEIAWKRLEERIKSIESTKFDNKSYQERFDQIGYGNEKHRRTYRVKENMSIDHLTGKSCTFKDFSRGKIELLS